MTPIEHVEVELIARKIATGEMQPLGDPPEPKSHDRWIVAMASIAVVAFVLLAVLLVLR